MSLTFHFLKKTFLNFDGIFTLLLFFTILSDADCWRTQPLGLELTWRNYWARPRRSLWSVRWALSIWGYRQLVCSTIQHQSQLSIIRIQICRIWRESVKTWKAWSWKLDNVENFVFDIFFKGSSRAVLDRIRIKDANCHHEPHEQSQGKKTKSLNFGYFGRTNSTIITWFENLFLKSTYCLFYLNLRCSGTDS